MRASTLLAALAIALLLAGCMDYYPYQGYGFRSTYSREDGRQIVQVLLSDPDIKKVADRVAPLVVEATVLGSGLFDPPLVQYQYLYDGSTVTNVSGRAADFKLKTTSSVVLGVINADDHFHVFACALSKDYATLQASNLAYAASFNAAKGRIIGSTANCDPQDGAKVTFRGLTGRMSSGRSAYMAGKEADILVFNEIGAPYEWTPSYWGLACKEPTLAQYCQSTVGYSVPSTDLDACTKTVTAQVTAPGWSAGKAAWEDEKAELAACNLLFGGS